MSDSADTATWDEFAAACPELAERVLARFESHRHVVMATLRADGSPRLSGMEAPIRDGHLWLGMEHASAKAADLRRDPRFGVHSAPDDETVAAGDARIDGRAGPASAELADIFAGGHRFDIEDPKSLALFTAQITRVVLVRVDEHLLVVDTWTPTGGATQHRVG